MNHVGILAGVTAVVVTTAVLLYMSRRSPPAPPAPPVQIATSRPQRAVASSPAGLGLQLDQLADRVAHLEQACALRAGAGGPAPLENDDDEHSPSSEELAGVPTQPLEDRFEEEDFDPGWSRAQEDALREAVSSPSEGSELEDIECATSLCRVLVRHESLDAQHLFAATAGATESLGASVFFDYQSKSFPPSTTLYVLREEPTARHE